MKLGIKTGLRSNSYNDLVVCKPDFTEVWFNANNPTEYKNLFQQIKKLKINCGLHFWGAVQNKILANIAYPDNEILQQSRNLIKQTIDIASQNHFDYVNIHPGGALLAQVDLNISPMNFIPLNKPKSFAETTLILKQSLQDLAFYAKKKQVKLFVESVPKYAYSPDKNGKTDRLNYKYLAETPLENIKSVLDIDNLFFTNDFGHTTANLISNNRNMLVDFLFQTSQELLEKTKLLHIGYLIKPYNGTDYHGSLTYPEINSDIAIPNYQELINLLRIYKNPNIWALVEPETDHIGNFNELKKIYNQSLK